MYGLHKFSIENTSILAISHLFWQFHTFFHTLLIFHSHQKSAYLSATRICMVYISFLLNIQLYHLFQQILYHIIHPFRRYKNIYDLHRFPIENSFVLAISHLFWQFNTFFSHLFQFFFTI